MIDFALTSPSRAASRIARIERALSLHRPIPGDPNKADHRERDYIWIEVMQECLSQLQEYVRDAA